MPEVDIKPAEGLSEAYISVYPYQSAESGDLSFEQGERMIVIKKEGEWWTGVIGDRVGIFPSNYVQPDDGVPVSFFFFCGYFLPLFDFGSVERRFGIVATNFRQNCHRASSCGKCPRFG